ncbi:helix-turn-helix transcriptional regulator [Achromobacter xylosoxidans]
MNTPDLIDLKEVAAVLRMHPEHVRGRLMRRIDFPRPLRLGGALRFERGEINDWIAAQRQPVDGRTLKRKSGNE